MKLIFIGLVLLFTNDSLALGRVVSYEEVNTSLFDSIEKVETCGDWRANNRFGHFRLLTLYYSGQNLLFLDIVALNDSETEMELIKGFTFKEINNDHADIIIEHLTCNSLGSNKIQVNAIATNGHNNQTFEFSLKVDGEKNTYQYKEDFSNQ